MVNIMLVCSAGMSTSALVNKMKTAAETRGIEANIWAISDSDTPSEIEKADVALLGPQVRFLEDKVKEVAGSKPVAVIDMIDYGTMNGDKVLSQALELLGK